MAKPKPLSLQAAFRQLLFRAKPLGTPAAPHWDWAQAEIVRHVFLLRHGLPLPGAPPLEQLESILPSEWKS